MPSSSSLCANDNYTSTVKLPVSSISQYLLPPTLLLLNNSDTGKFLFKRLLVYLYPSCIPIFCIISSSASTSFLIHRKQEQDGKVRMKYPSLCGRKRRQLSQAMLTNSPNTAKYPAPPLLQLQLSQSNQAPPLISTISLFENHPR